MQHRSSAPGAARGRAMKRGLIASAMGIGAFIAAGNAWAWMDLQFSTTGVDPSQVVLRCPNANHQAPCSGAGVQAGPRGIEWNPLDGHTSSHYEFTLEGEIKVDLRMTDRRTGCAVAQPDAWHNGWTWQASWRGPDGAEHVRDVCTDGGVGGQSPRLWLTAKRYERRADADTRAGAFYVLILDTLADPNAGTLRPRAAFMLDVADRKLEPLE